MNTCDTCKWWSGQVTHTSYGTANPLLDLYGSCDNPKVNGDHPLQHAKPDGTYRFFRWSVAKAEVPDAWCAANKIERASEHTIPLDQASPSASDDQGLCFATGPKFGCIHHEPSANPASAALPATSDAS